MKAAKLFMNGQSQAVRLPKEFRFEGREVFVQRVGEAVVLLPKTEAWGPLLSGLGAFSADMAQSTASRKRGKKR